MKFVKYTSIGLIIGFGGYACYRLIVKQRVNCNVKFVPNAKPTPLLPEPVAEDDFTTKTVTPSFKSLPKKDEKKDKASSIDVTNHASHPIDSEKLVNGGPERIEDSEPDKLDQHTDETSKDRLNEKNEVRVDAETDRKPIEEAKDIISKETIDENVTKSIEKNVEETNEEKEPAVALSSDVSKSDLVTTQNETLNSTTELDASVSSDKRNNSKEMSIISNDSPSTTNCSLDVCPSTPCSSPLDVSELDGETTIGSIDISSAQPSFSMTSQSSVIGEGMVAKLEQLLCQVGNLKETVGEMNADLATVHKIETKISGDDISFGEEMTGDSMIANGKEEVSQTPSLEWDSAGINLVSDPGLNHSTIKEEDESILNESLLGDSLLSEKSELFSPISSVSLNSSTEPSLIISSLTDMTDPTEKTEISSFNFSTSDTNENFDASKSIAQSNGSLLSDK